MEREEEVGPMIVGEGFEQYLEAIYHLEEVEREASTSALAEWLEVRMASVTGMLKRLQAAGLVWYEAYQPATLGPAGRAVALRIVRRHRLWEVFLCQHLGMAWHQVYVEACDLEHATSLTVESALDHFLGEPRVCPHGFPIPDAAGHVDEPTSSPLNRLEPGTRGTVVRISERRVELLEYLTSKGVQPGAPVRVEEIAPFDGPITITVRDTSLSLSPQVAGLILVEPAEQDTAGAMEVLLISPYHTGSHAGWAEGLVGASRHHITSLTLTGFFWKWRMHGGAVTLARTFMAGDLRPDVILATDMLDLTTFLALTRARTHATPAVVYMHENQLTYPLRAGEKRDLHYGFINYASALAAGRVFFNSDYHRDCFFTELPRLLKHFPDYNELPSVETLRARSAVLPLGLDLVRLDTGRPHAPRAGRPLILWNHRWEYDKNPAEFFAALYCLAEEGLEFEVALAGENYRVAPAEFEEARTRLGTRIVHYGYVSDAAAYARLLWRADVLPVTSRHEFFGASVVQALYCDTLPILPRRLTYPDYIPPAWQDACLYDDFEGLVGRLRRAVLDIDATRRVSLRPQVAGYDWSVMGPRYDAALEEAAAS